jgi:hypothetical protein
MGLYKQGPVPNLELFKTKSKGTIAGEGAAFFLLANEPSATDYAKLDGLKTFYKPQGIKEIKDHILSFLGAHSITFNNIDLVICGRNGDAGSDEVFDQLQQSIFSKIDTINYKNLCGEYPTATAFALWVAANIIKSGTVPTALGYPGAKENKIKRILIYNHYLNLHHSLLLISAC